jgi:biotin synthase
MGVDPYLARRMIRAMPTPAERSFALSLLRRPLLDLVFEAAAVHRRHHDASDVQRCALLSIKTGGCPEDCAYCPQSARYESPVDRSALLERDAVREAARRAREEGATRFCMGAAWRSVKDGPEFDRVLEMVGDVAELGMEVCCTLGMLSESQARRLKEAGLTAYNHNLDTSESFYASIVTTRTYEDRLQTLRRVRDAGISVCCGGILGMGESLEDRADLLATLAALDPPPESVPINGLVRVEGTPLADAPDLDPLDLVRTVAAARILMPRARIRLAAGRQALSPEAQALCFLAGANSVFFGEKLLTTPNPDVSEDADLFRRLGLAPSDGVTA